MDIHKQVESLAALAAWCDSDSHLTQTSAKEWLENVEHRHVISTLSTPSVSETETEIGSWTSATSDERDAGVTSTTATHNDGSTSRSETASNVANGHAPTPSASRSSSARAEAAQRSGTLDFESLRYRFKRQERLSWDELKARGLDRAVTEYYKLLSDPITKTQGLIVKPAPSTEDIINQTLATFFPPPPRFLELHVLYLQLVKLLGLCPSMCLFLCPLIALLLMVNSFRIPYLSGIGQLQILDERAARASLVTCSFIFLVSLWCQVQHWKRCKRVNRSICNITEFQKAQHISPAAVPSEHQHISAAAVPSEHTELQPAHETPSAHDMQLLRGEIKLLKEKISGVCPDIDWKNLTTDDALVILQRLFDQVGLPFQPCSFSAQYREAVSKVAELKAVVG